MANLGIMYLFGLGVEQDPQLALEFLKGPSAETSLASAVNTLGYMHYHGIGTCAFHSSVTFPAPHL